MSLGEDTILNNRYQILRVLSDKGGMGVIYQAHDLNLNGTVVIKQSRFTEQELRRQYPNWPIEQIRNQAEYLRKAFEREAKLLFGLRHSALPRVIDYFATPDGNQFFVMEFIPGKDFGDLLDERLKQNQGPFPLDQVLDWADQILSALDYLHTQFDPPIIHRDIKPQNLKLMPNGQVILLDFGLAKGASPGVSVVESIWGGTPEYAPLEQVDEDENEKQKSGPRSDLYSLALTLHHLLSGQKPAKTISRLNAKAQDRPDPLRPLNEVVPRIPETVSAVLQRAASVFAGDRLATAAEMRQLLRQSVAPPPPATTVPQPKPEIETVVRPKRSMVIFLNSGNEDIKPVVETRPAQPRSFSEDLGNGVTLEMVYIPGGSFLMGSKKEFLTGLKKEKDETPLHRVTLTPFFIGKYPVTDAQWGAVMFDNPIRGSDHPVSTVNWRRAVDFCNVMSKHTGRTYRLPTESEWEYACRAGSQGKWCFSDDESLLELYAWYYKNSGGLTHPVGLRHPNQFGLYDMHGNVLEWCQDWYHDKYYRNSPEQDPLGPSESERVGWELSWKVTRGGSFGDTAEGCRSAYRIYLPANCLKYYTGFRLACVAMTM